MATRARLKALIGMTATLLGVAPACHRTPPTKIVVGVQSDPMNGAVASLRIVAKVGGVVAFDERVTPQKGALVGFPQPWEREILGDGRLDAPVEVEVDAFA